MVLLREAEGETKVGGGEGREECNTIMTVIQQLHTCMYLKILDLKQCLVTAILP